ncbi:MAG: PAS domain S-box protein [Alphaproteobacteria bacterium]
MSTLQSVTEQQRVTFYKVIFLSFIICLLPAFLNLCGVDFSSSSHALDAHKIASDGIIVDDLFHALRGSLHHALLEWSAVSIALLTVLLSFAHFGISKDVTTPIIGIAMFCSGMMDAFHTMAAMRLIEASAPNTDLIPFTWALSRTFNAAIMMIGIAICLRLDLTRTKAALKTIIMISAGFGITAYLLIHFAARSPYLPQTQYPDAFITRPLDALPLALFIIIAPLFWRLYLKNPNFLTASMVLTLIPAAILEVHMAFGSSHLFDNHFNIAHFLKIIEYFIPFIGLSLEYIRTHRLLQRAETKLTSINEGLEERIQERTASLELIQRVAIGANQAESVQGAMQQIITEICHFTKWPIGHVYLYSQTDEHLKPTNIWFGDDKAEFSNFINVTNKTFFKAGEGLPGRVLKHKHPAWISDVQSDPNFPRNKEVKDIKVHAAFAFPVMIENDVVAVLEFFADIIMEPDEEILETMAIIGTQVGRVIEREQVQEQLERRVKERTADAQASSARIQAILETAADAIITIDARGSIQSFNEAAEEIFGYHEEDVINRNVNMLMPNPYHNEHDDYLLNYITTGTKKIIGSTRAIEALRKNGETFPIELSISEIETNEERLFTGFIRDVSEKKKVEYDLISAKEQAEAASFAKSEFLANMSHEIRTPMNGIIGTTSLLKETFLSGKQRDYLSTIQNSSDALLQLINDILDLSKIEAGKLDFEILPFNIETLIEEVQSVMFVNLRDDVAFHISCPNDMPRYVLGDPGRIRQVLFNLVSNAIKFTEKGSISLSIEVLEQKGNTQAFKLSVKDTGIGIPEDKQDTIFQKFSQAEESTTRRFGGTGLGLAICRELVKLMDGEIHVKSVYGEGSTFWFTMHLPLCSADEVEDETNHENNISTDELLFKNTQALLVEDNPTNQVIAMEILEQYGCHTTPAGNGREAVERFSKQHFDVIFMDCRMPEMDGYEATKKIRQYEEDRKLSPTPILALTANAIKGDRDKCISVGMDDYISKPIQKAHIGRALLKWLPDEKQDTRRIEQEDCSSTATSNKDPEHNDLSVFDHNTFDNMKELMGDGFAPMIQQFLDNSSKYIAQAQEGLANNNAKLIADAVHPLKASSAVLGVIKVSQLAAKIEKGADEVNGSDDKKISVLSQTIQDLHDAFIDVEETLKAGAGL